MNIHEKLTRMQTDLLKIPIKKSGVNKFGGFQYYELEDLLPPILTLCLEYGATLYFNFPSDVNGECNRGVLNLINWEDKEDKIQVEVPFAQLEKLPKMNYAQSSGTYQTYMKRYLILHTFDIVETETIDALDNNPNTIKKTTNSSQNTKNKKSQIQKPASLEKVIKKCEELEEKECDKRTLNKVSLKMFRSKEITKEERKEIVDYLNNAL